jgi:hypothetical protein
MTKVLKKKSLLLLAEAFSKLPTDVKQLALDALKNR